MWELLYKKGLVWKGKSDNSVRKVCAPGQSLSFCSSAWNDGKIRAFVPATGEPMYEINNAHNLGVTAIAATSDCKQIISGGGDGQVRIWNIGEKTQKLREVLKEHRGAVSCIKTNKNDKEGVTASLDGTCVIWDLERYVRKQMILDNTLFKCVCYHRGEYQIITSGTDRKQVVSQGGAETRVLLTAS
ncbi:cilia- and flagella-associated protein 52-like [Columba livia]|uniref:cilia- and flagella-associated protein 52-like n=1 Tax=Columba livia TaxID=8932 RepID=UPI0031BB549C